MELSKVEVSTREIERTPATDGRKFYGGTFQIVGENTKLKTPAPHAELLQGRIPQWNASIAHGDRWGWGQSSAVELLYGRGYQPWHRMNAHDGWLEGPKFHGGAFPIDGEPTKLKAQAPHAELPHGRFPQWGTGRPT